MLITHNWNLAMPRISQPITEIMKQDSVWYANILWDWNAEIQTHGTINATTTITTIQAQKENCYSFVILLLSKDLEQTYWPIGAKGTMRHWN